MKYIAILIATISLFFLSSPLYAEERYEIGKDGGGVYFQTNNHGGWYIDQDDLKYFNIGDTGYYTLRNDQNGTYILTDKNHKFYIDIASIEQKEKEIELN